MDEQSSKKNQRKREKNPRDLFNIIFWALVAAAIILVIVLIVTASKLGKANRALASAEGGTSITQKAEYEAKISDLTAQLDALKTENDQLKAELQTVGGSTAQPNSGTASGTTSGTSSGTTSGTASGTASGTTSGTASGTSSGTASGTGSASSGSAWLNLAPYNKLQVKPKDSEFYSGFETRYVKATELNVRSGPAATYDKLSTVKQGDQISAAAESGEWTLISYGSGYGWVKTEFLSLTPVSVSSGTSGGQSSSTGGQGSSSQTGTSGNMQ
ncbi:MAG: SH3 domain-containing protein [Oscillospiraceae bacterium]|nr:SH3 domain-containing protein [Oscillospiraceae bacterium]